MTMPGDPAQILADALRRSEEAKRASRDAARKAVEDLEVERAQELDL